MRLLLIAVYIIFSNFAFSDEAKDLSIKSKSQVENINAILKEILGENTQELLAYQEPVEKINNVQEKTSNVKTEESIALPSAVKEPAANVQEGIINVKIEEPASLVEACQPSTENISNAQEETINIKTQESTALPTVVQPSTENIDPIQEMTSSVNIEEPIALPTEVQAPIENISNVQEETANVKPEEPAPVEAVAPNVEKICGILLLSPCSNQDTSNVKGVVVRNLELHGPFSHLLPYIEPFIGKELTANSIDDIKKGIKNFYQDCHYPFILVEAPEQKITEGVLTFIVYESHLGKISYKGNEYFRQKKLKKYIHFKSKESINSRQVAKDLTLINRNPFRNATAIFKPGSKENTTDLEIWVSDKTPYRIYAGVDNTGIVSTKHTRFFAGANFGNVWGLDHVLSYQFTAAPEINKFWSQTGSYTLPILGRHFLTVFGGFSQTKPSPSIVDVKNVGKSSQASLRYIIPLMPQNNLSHEVDFGADYKYSNINLIYRGIPFVGNSVNITQLVGIYQGRYSVKEVRLPFELQLYFSPGKIISDQSPASFSQFRYKAKNHYVYTQLQCSPTFMLPQEYYIFLNVQGQFATGNLLSSEQMALGGFNTVRGYEEREVNKDNGILTNIEIRTPYFRVWKKLPRKDELQFLVFIDYGLGWDHTATPGVKNLMYLWGFGPGFRYNIANNLVCRLDCGFKMHHTNAVHSTDWGKFHFSLIGSF